MNLHVLVSAGKKDSQITKWANNTLHVRLNAPPTEGKANLELIRFLADQFDLAPSTISLTKGHTAKQKTLVLPLSQEQFQAQLTKLLART